MSQSWIRALLLLHVFQCSAGKSYKVNFHRFHLPWQSESQQDEKLVEHLFRNRRWGTFVELGAADGKYLSNTYALEQGMEWFGILIEPLPQQAEKCRLNRPQASCIQACVTKVPGLYHFREDTVRAVQSGLTRLNVAQEEGSIHRKIHCRTLPDILKEHGAPRVIDWLSLDVERAEMEVMESVFEDGVFHFDVISLEAMSEQDSFDRLAFMLKHGYQFMDRFGDDVYVYTWTREETQCPKSEWLRRKLLHLVSGGFEGDSQLELLRRARASAAKGLNDTTLGAYKSFARKGRHAKCKAADMNFLMRIALQTTSIDDFGMGICVGGAFMEPNELLRRINPELYDDCSPLWSLPLGRMDFIHVLQTRWPTFLQLQLISERMSRDYPSGELCDLYERPLPVAGDFFFRRQDDLEDQAKMCGGLRLVLRYLDRAKTGNSPRLSVQWTGDVAAAERMLKLLAHKTSVAVLMSSIGQLPEERSPWLLLNSLQERWW